MNRKIFDLYDCPYSKDIKRFLPDDRWNMSPIEFINGIKAISTGVRRVPKKGEWYLPRSPFPQQAFKAFNNSLKRPYLIAKLVLTETETIVKIVKE